MNIFKFMSSFLWNRGGQPAKYYGLVSVIYPDLIKLSD